MTRALLLVGAVLLGAAGPPADPDWPCVQRLVPRLTAGTLWGGHPAKSDWRSDPQIAAIVQRVAPRSVSAERGVAELDTFAAAIPAPARPDVLADVFAGLVDETNEQRGEIIGRLREITRRQRALAEAASRVGTELTALPDSTPTAQRTEVTDRRALLIREYEEIERTIRYACEVPVRMEAKLGRLAQALQRQLP